MPPSPTSNPKRSWPNFCSNSNPRCAKPPKNSNSKKPPNSATASAPSNNKTSPASSAKRPRKAQPPPPSIVLAKVLAEPCSAGFHASALFFQARQRANFKPSHNPPAQLFQFVKGF